MIRALMRVEKLLALSARKAFFRQSHSCVRAYTTLCAKSTHIGSLFCLTLQSVGINRMRTHTRKVYFAISFNRLRCQIVEKWATQF